MTQKMKWRGGGGTGSKMRRAREEPEGKMEGRKEGQLYQCLLTSHSGAQELKVPACKARVSTSSTSITEQMTYFPESDRSK